MNNNRHQPTTESASVSQQTEKLHFLCAHHRDWVYFNSQEALEHLEQIQLKGEFLLEHQKWQEAMPLLGCAWETTSILLDLYSGEKTFLVNKLCGQTILLSTCLSRLGHLESARQISAQTLSTLSTLREQLDPKSENHTHLQKCMTQLQDIEFFPLYAAYQPQGKLAVLLH